MIGRAGRPQFDTSATAVIMTTDGHKSRYESLVNGTQKVESYLHENLVEHLNAEIVLSTIADIGVALVQICHLFELISGPENVTFCCCRIGFAQPSSPSGPPRIPDTMDSRPT